MKELTKAEEQVMQVLWHLKKGFVKDVLQELPPPRPAYNTVSTIIRILEKKGFVGYHAFGKTHEYYPLVEKGDYSKFAAKGLLDRFFGGSLKQMVSFFVEEENLSLQETDELLRLLREQQNDPAKDE
mgnify:CR=1 FL=1